MFGRALSGPEVTLALAARIVHSSIFTGMSILWVFLLTAMVRFKVKRRGSLTPRSRAVIAGAAILSLAYIYNRYSGNVCGLIELLRGAEAFRLYFTFQLYVFDSIVNFLVACSLLYLYYF